MALALPAQPLLSAFALRAAGVTRTDEKTISEILGAYNRANSMNVIALHTLLNLMSDGELALRSHAATDPTSKGEGARVENDGSVSSNAIP